MNHYPLHTTMHRRTLLGGLAIFGSLTPSLVAAQNGLKSAGDDEETDDELAAIGVTGEQSYESPQFGYRLTWDRHWFVPEDDPGTTSDTEEWDTLHIRWVETPSPLGAVVQLSFDGFRGVPQTTETWLAGMADPDTLTGFFGSGGKEASVALVAEEGNIQEVVWRLSAPDDPEDMISMVSAYRVLDEKGLMLMSTLAIIAPEELTDSVASLIDDVMLDDEPLIQLLSLEDIEAAFATLD